MKENFETSHDEMLKNLEEDYKNIKDNHDKMEKNFEEIDKILNNKVA